ncbi:MAG: SLBB domain-containing protein [Cyanobacteria bacterium]|nr:SLBB domain-containing protein [Cyanobacteriota bacterium]
MSSDSVNSVELIKSAGVVGAGGAGFPTHVKLSAKVDTLIVNGAECEPLINVDRQLIERYFERVYAGLKVAVQSTGTKKVIIALKSKNKDALETLENFKQDDVKFEIFKLGNFYPAGDEQVLVNEVTGRIVPEGGIPLNVGIVVINVETLINVANAVEGKNLTRKFVTVNGAVENPKTFFVPIGTPVLKLIEACGGATTQNYEVIDGGPMTGKLINPNTHAVTKTTKAILVLPDTNIVVIQKKRNINAQLKRAQAICLSCRMCTDLCPRYLLGHDLFPDELMKRMYKKEISADNIANFDFAYLCCDCGLCELYSCVVDLSARSIFNYLKVELAKAGIKNPHHRDNLTVNEFRDFRKVPVPRLLKRIDLDKYTSHADLSDDKILVNEVKLFLTQHVGVPSQPVVKIGDSVSEGMLIADIPDDKLGSRIHASISGKVKEITEKYIIISKN